MRADLLLVAGIGWSRMGGQESTVKEMGCGDVLNELTATIHSFSLCHVGGTQAALGRSERIPGAYERMVVMELHDNGHPLFTSQEWLGGVENSVVKIV